jgi:solute:Na+ symporter, SSS family
MILTSIDWLIVILFLVLSLIIGLRFKKEGSSSISAFFLGGRNLPWYLAGISMVATTFAADTPLAVTELVAKNGISSNWLWWNMLAGGMLTTFFFAKYWRRAEILTEVAFIEMRYSGKPATFLRGFKAIYLGLFMNVMIIGWVNLAMISILQVFLDVSYFYAFIFTGLLMLIALIYSSLSGLIGVAVTDAVQFLIAIVGCIILSVIVVNSDAIGGISGLKSKLPEGSLDFFPSITSESSITTKLGISIGAFLSFSMVQWWASWYPGAEPGGGGYIAQRMMSSKDEKHAFFATLFFQVAHYCLRPWPWILVGLCSLVLYPELSIDDKKMGFVYAMKDFLPTGLKGLLFVAFIAAYMSTISTQLNWGASYLTNDFLNRFILKKETPEKKLVLIAKLTTLFIMIFALITTTFMTSISGVWEFIIECGAGLGLVLILRWYWWRINAWSEIVATITPFIVYGLNQLYFIELMPESWIDHKIPFFITVLTTTLAWIIITFTTKPTQLDVLLKFYNKILPDGNWSPFKDKKTNHSHLINLIISWLLSIIFTYSLLFLTGNIIFQEWNYVIILLPIVFISLWLLIRNIYKENIVIKN